MDFNDVYVILNGFKRISTIVMSSSMISNGLNICYFMFYEFKQFLMNFTNLLADSGVKNHDFQNINWKFMKISETCMKFREESISDHTGVPK